MIGDGFVTACNTGKGDRAIGIPGDLLHNAAVAHGVGLVHTVSVRVCVKADVIGGGHLGEAVVNTAVVVDQLVVCQHRAGDGEGVLPERDAGAFRLLAVFVHRPGEVCLDQFSAVLGKVDHIHLLAQGKLELPVVIEAHVHRVVRLEHFPVFPADGQIKETGKANACRLSLFLGEQAKRFGVAGLIFLRAGHQLHKLQGRFFCDPRPTGNVQQDLDPFALGGQLPVAEGLGTDHAPGGSLLRPEENGNSGAVLTQDCALQLRQNGAFFRKTNHAHVTAGLRNAGIQKANLHPSAAFARQGDFRSRSVQKLDFKKAGIGRLPGRIGQSGGNRLTGPVEQAVGGKLPHRQLRVRGNRGAVRPANHDLIVLSPEGKAVAIRTPQDVGAVAQRDVRFARLFGVSGFRPLRGGVGGLEGLQPFRPLRQLGKSGNGC